MHYYTEEQHKALSDIAEFDHVFVVLEGGQVSEVRNVNIYAPEAYEPDPYATTLDGWELPLSGFTGQYGYNGPWLHNSEVITGGVADYVLAHPGYWVPIYAMYDDGPEGWTLAYTPFTKEGDTRE